MLQIRAFWGRILLSILAEILSKNFATGASDPDSKSNERQKMLDEFQQGVTSGYLGSWGGSGFCFGTACRPFKTWSLFHQFTTTGQ